MNHLKKVGIIFILVLLASVTMLLSAQEKEKSAKEKLKELKGKAQEIVIKTDEGEVVLKGKDAERYLKRLKSKSNLSMLKNLDIDHDFKNVFVFSDDDGETVTVDLESFDGDESSVSKTFHVITSGDMCDEGTQNISIDFTEKDGVKNLTVETIDDDGNKTVKTYTGEDAERKIKELEAQKKFRMGGGPDEDIVWITVGDDLEEELTFEITEEDDELKVVVKEEDEDGDVVKKEYVGDDAEEWLKEHKIKKEIGKGFYINTSKNDFRTKKKVKVKIITDDEDDD